ncbi:hypothetical protein DFH06DRAFT_1465765 [Mycena polygramma]|nr:hypothetical protein DFH06DRAFT_1465765 [Mycena polygramma]
MCYARARAVLQRLWQNDLPLGNVRLVFMVLSLVFSIIEGGLCVKIWTKHHTAQKLLNANLSPGISAVLEYQDVRTTSILLFVANQLVTMPVAHIIIMMLHDIYNFIPAFVLRRFKPTKGPMTSVTLAHQAIALLVSTACFIVAGVFHTMFVFDRSGTLSVHQGAVELPASTVQPTLDRLGIALPYRDVQYIRISGEMPWPAAFFLLGANVVTLIAWYKYRRAPVDSPSVEETVKDSVEAEKSSELEKEWVEMSVLLV